MIRIFEDLPVDAGFTCKPADGKVYRADLLKKAPVVRLSLVHGSSVAVIRSVDPAVEKRIIQGTKRRVLKEGVILEQFTFDDWIRHIEEL